MKRFFETLMVCLCFLSAAFPLEAQEKVTLNVTEMQFYKFLRELEKQSEYTFFYSNAVIKGMKPVSFSGEQVSVSAVLDEVLRGSGRSYEIVGKQIAIIMAESAAPAAQAPEKQPASREEPRRISGKVSDISGEPLPMATVFVSSDTRKATSADVNGRYVLDLGKDDRSITVSYVGYLSKEVTVGDKETVDVALVPDPSFSLNETVVIGYGTTKKQDLTGSVATVKMADIQAVPVTSIDQALQGRIAGVDVVGASSDPGRGTSINIRGARSITASNEPLIVVDGVMDAVTDINEINPSDIESISVLKDASSTAIYGAKGANGVIMITTRMGSTAKPSVNVKLESGVSQIARTLDVMNTEEFIRYRNDYYQLNQFASNPLPRFDAADYTNNTDWIKQISRLAPYQNYYFSISGSEKGGNYLGSLSYTDEEGIIKASGMQRFSGRVNLSKQFYKWLKIFMNINASYTVKDINKAKFGGSNITNGAMYLAPLIGPLDRSNPLYENGVLINTPYASIKYEDYYSTSLYNSYTAGIYITPVKDLVFKSWNSYNTSTYDTFHFWPSYMPKKTSDEGADAYRYTQERVRMSSENTLNYKTTFGGSQHFEGLLGWSASVLTHLAQSLTAKSMLDDESQWKNFAAIGSKENYSIASNYRKQTKMSFFARANYDYAKKYFLTVTVRGDGSSNFAENNKWGFFPSAAFKWDIRKEPFMKSLRWLNQFALRASYGRTGNDDIPAYMSLQAYGTTASYVFDGVNGIIYAPSRLANPDLTWEKTDQLNLALETSMFSSRLNINLEGYVSKTSDLLLNVGLMRSTGYASRLSNLGRTSNMGVELTVESRNVTLSKFGWTSIFTVSHNRQMVEDIGHYNYVSTVTSLGNARYMMYGYKKDYPLNSLWGFEYGGVVHNVEEFYDNQTSHRYVYRDNLSETTCLGHSRYIDQNGDGVLDNNDLVYLGNADPKLLGGLQNNFYIGKLKLSLFLAYSLGGKMYNYSELYMAGGLYSNQYRYMLDSWHPVRNPGSDIPRAGDTANVMLPSSFQVHDASWLRIQDLSLQYTFDLSRTKVLKKLTLGISGKNLWLWTRYNGFDPDVSADDDGVTLRRVDMNAYPSARRIVLSINMNM